MAALRSIGNLLQLLKLAVIVSYQSERAERSAIQAGIRRVHSLSLFSQNMERHHYSFPLILSIFIYFSRQIQVYAHRSAPRIIFTPRCPSTLRESAYALCEKSRKALCFRGLRQTKCAREGLRGFPGQVARQLAPHHRPRCRVHGVYPN